MVKLPIIPKSSSGDIIHLYRVIIRWGGIVFFLLQINTGLLLEALTAEDGARRQPFISLLCIRKVVSAVHLLYFGKFLEG